MSDSSPPPDPIGGRSGRARCRSPAERFADLVERRAPWLLILLAGITAFLLWHAAQARFDFSFETFFETSDPEFAAYQEFVRRFGSDADFLYVAYERPDLFTREGLIQNERLCRGIERLPGVIEVRGLSRFPTRLSVFSLLLQPSTPAGAQTGGAPAVAAAQPGVFRREVLASRLAVPSIVSEDGTATAILIELDPAFLRTDGRHDLLRELRALTDSEAATSDARFHLAGLPTIEAEYVRLIRRDQWTFIPISAGLFVLFLFLYFGTLRGILLPTTTVALAVGWTVGALSLGGEPIGLLTSLIPTLLIVMGIGDSIFILSRHVEESTFPVPGSPTPLWRTVSSMSAACLLTSVTTAIGFSTLIATDLHVVRRFGFFAALGVMLAYAVSMLWVPPLLGLLPPPGKMRRLFGAEVGWLTDRMMCRLASLVSNRPWLIFFGALSLGGAALFLASRVTLSQSWFQDLKSGNPTTQAHRFLEDRLGGAFSMEIEFCASREGGLRDPATLRSLAEVVDLANADPRVRQAVSFVDFIREGNRLFRGGGPEHYRVPGTAPAVEMISRFAGQAATPALFRRFVDETWTRGRLSLRVREVRSPEMTALSAKIEEALRDRGFLDREPGAALQVGDTTRPAEFTFTGKSVVAGRAMARVIDNMKSSLGLALVLIFASMSILFRSLRIGALSMIPNLLPIVWTFGLMGACDIPLNFSTMTVFSIALGVAVDSTIHYLSRFREEVARDGDARAATDRTLRGTGPAMLFSTLLLTSGFCILMTSQFVFTARFGVLGAFTMVAALAMDLLLTPAIGMIYRPKGWGRGSIAPTAERK
ncbi:MAG: MMPL family transporter [Planctomycetes bacterium]|nr:MMPL family transporter [Planctomycetota bacterium]